MRMETKEFYLRSPEEMLASFVGHEDALRQSQAIADSVEIELELGKRHFPVFTVPEGESPEDFLRALVLKGLKDRYKNLPKRWNEGELSQEVMERLEREMYVINKLGFPNYFLIVWDFVHFARSRGIEATARGSGVGSLVAYGLYLSHVCPLEHDLLFERFLDENRKEAPDIDIDFDQQRRGEVIQYVEGEIRYGERGADRHVRHAPSPGRHSGCGPSPGAAHSPRECRGGHGARGTAHHHQGGLGEERRSEEDLRERRRDSRTSGSGDASRGTGRNVGTHAAAVVIADRPLEDYLPLQHITGKEEVITQWAMADVERAGLLKMDFLGLRNLTILSNVVKLIEQTTGQKVNPYEFPLDDQETFALLCRGETKGVFQLESGGIRDLLQRMKPDHFRDIIATNALYRPGPLEGGMVDDYIQVKHHRKVAEYKHPAMKEILEETHAVMVYQEQVMRILNRLGGIKLANAYTCIKAISKKKLPMIEKFRGEFLEGAQSQGLTKKDAEELFGLIEKFAGYGFNKSHSTAYALVAYMTAYLKAHWPVEFMAALLTSDMPGRNFKTKDSLVEHLEDCQRMKIEVVPPDVNLGGPEFTVGDGKIFFGLGAIKGCGLSAAEAIVAARKKGGAVKSLFDFCERLDSGTVNRTAIESLIKAGAFDSFGARRAQLFAAVDRAIQSGVSAASDRRSGQMGLFGGDEEEEQVASASLPDVPEWEERDRLTKEKEVLGFYLSSHPLAQHAQALSTYCSHSTVEAAALAHRNEAMLGGMLSAIKFAHTKNPRPGSPLKYAMFDLEDMDGMMRCILWPEQFAQFGELVQPEAILAVQGVVDKRPGSDEANFIVNELIPLDDLAQRFTRGMVIRLLEDVHGLRAVEQLYEILRGYPGDRELQIVICLSDGTRVTCACEGFRIEITAEMRAGGRAHRSGQSAASGGAHRLFGPQ